MTPIWDTSGAYVLYGAAMTGVFGMRMSRNSTRSAEKIAREQRENDAAQVREQRSHSELARAYEEYMVHVVRIQTAVTRARRTGEWDVAPPDDDLFRLTGNLLIFGSEAVRDLSQSSNEAVTEFYRHLEELKMLQGLTPIEQAAMVDHGVRETTLQIGFISDSQAVLAAAEATIAQIRRELGTSGESVSTGPPVAPAVPTKSLTVSHWHPIRRRRARGLEMPPGH
jgi:hypothetical protein